MPEISEKEYKMLQRLMEKEVARTEANARRNARVSVMLKKAELAGITVSDDEIEAELSRRS